MGKLSDSVDLQKELRNLNAKLDRLTQEIISIREQQVFPKHERKPEYFGKE